MCGPIRGGPGGTSIWVGTVTTGRIPDVDGDGPSIVDNITGVTGYRSRQTLSPGTIDGVTVSDE